MNQQDEDFRMWARAAELGSGWAGGVGGYRAPKGH